MLKVVLREVDYRRLTIMSIKLGRVKTRAKTELSWHLKTNNGFIFCTLQYLNYFSFPFKVFNLQTYVTHLL